MRAVLDTSVVVSSFIKTDSPPGQIINLWKKGEIRLVFSEEIAREYAATLERLRQKGKLGFYVTTGLIKALARTLIDPLHGERVEPMQRHKVCRDPSDDKFLECAAEGKADAIVSGDNDLLSMESFQGIPILSPREFLTHFRSRLA